MDKRNGALVQYLSDRSLSLCHSGHIGHPLIPLTISFEKAPPPKMNSPKLTISQIALRNRSLVLGVFGEGEKLTIREASERVNESLPRDERLSGRTIRRCVDDLIKSAFLQQSGRENSAILYSRLSSIFTDSDEKLVNFGGNLVTVKSFIQAMVGEDEAPLQRSPERRVLSMDIEHQIRRRLAFVLLSAGEPGMNDQLEKTRRALYKFLDEIKFIAAILENFVDSPVWFEQYRDKIAAMMRELQKEDPELFQKTIEYVKGG